MIGRTSENLNVGDGECLLYESCCVLLSFPFLQKYMKLLRKRPPALPFSSLPCTSPLFNAEANFDGYSSLVCNNQLSFIQIHASCIPSPVPQRKKSRQREWSQSKIIFIPPDETYKRNETVLKWQRSNDRTLITQSSSSTDSPSPPAPASSSLFS